MESSIEKALQIPLNERRKSKEKRTKEIMPFLYTCNPDNPNITSSQS